MGRHGPQTGLEAQGVRAATSEAYLDTSGSTPKVKARGPGVTPDSASNPAGTAQRSVDRNPDGTPAGTTAKWTPTVRPPRLGGSERRGVFATRSPFRPNPIGLTCVKLDRIEIVDGAPVIRRLSDDGSLAAVAHSLFATLRDLDGGTWARIHAERAPGRSALALAINDRLTRAAAKR